MTVSVIAGGRVFTGWTDVEITRALDQAAASFVLTSTDYDPERNQAWRLLPGTEVVVEIEGNRFLTGYVDTYAPRFTATSHQVTISGRSRTADLVDSSVDVLTGSFSGYSLVAIARAVARQHGIEVASDVAAGPISSVQLQQGETGFALVERLARSQGVLVTDDVEGRQWLTQAGSERTDALIQGENIKAAAASLSESNRFRTYKVKGQESGLAWRNQVGAEALASVTAIATDGAARAGRVYIEVSGGQITNALARKRVNWLARTSAGNALQAKVTVQGWLTRSGRPWSVNQRSRVTSSFLGLDQELLIVATTFKLSNEGTTTELTLQPPESMTPEPIVPARVGSSDEWKVDLDE